MPTLNPRTQVTLSPSLDRLVVRLASMQRMSKSQVLRELLEAAEPALQRAVVLMEAASTATAQVHDGLARSLSQAQDSLEARMQRELAKMDAMAADLVAQAESVRVRRPARGTRSVPELVGAGDKARGRPNPPPSNRGVKSVKRRSGGGS